MVLPKSDAATGCLFHEPFRWDQRVWITVLRCPGMSDSLGRTMQAQSLELTSNTGPIATIAEMTGARAQVVQGMRQLSTAVDSLCQRLNQGARKTCTPSKQSAKVQTGEAKHQRVPC